MTQREDGLAQRAARRRSWPIRSYALGTEPNEDLSDSTTPEQRLAMMWQLALDAWAAAGIPIPDYPRSAAPGRVVRPDSDDLLAEASQR